MLPARRTRLGVLTSLIILALMLAACPAPAPAEPVAPVEEPTPEEPTPAAVEPTTLVIGLTEDTVSLDPGRAFETHANTVHRTIYQTLVTFPPDRVDEIIGDLAADWEISDDGLVYTFNLKEGQKFSTGREVTAEDVAFSLNRMRHIKGNPAFLADNIASVEATDQYTVVITLQDVDPSLLARLVFTAFAVIDSEEARAHGATASEDAATEDAAEEWLNDNSIGSGPYMLQKWEPRVETVLVRNPEYAGPPAAIDRVIYRTLADAAAQKLALEAGDIDIALDVSADQVPSLKDNPDIEVYEGLSNTVWFLVMNVDPDIGGPVSDNDVQNAIRLALDYDGLRLLAGGASATLVSIMPVNFPYTLDGSHRIQRDLDAARARLAAAGYEDGLTLELEYPEFSSGGLAFSTVAQKVQADLTEAGINVQLRPGELQVALERYRNGESPFSLWLWFPDFIDPIDRVSFLPEGKVGERANWTFERASEEMVEVTRWARVATASAEREEAFRQAQLLSLEESAFAFLVQTGLQVGYRADLQDFTFNIAWRVDPYTMSK